MLKNFFDKEISIKSFILLISALYGIYLLPFLLNSYYFMDDNVRVVIGNPDWGWQGRPLADYIMYFLSSNTQRITNIHPLPLIMSVSFLVYVIYYIVKKYSTRVTVKLLIPYVMFLANPFFVHNLFYMYDAPLMILAMALSIFAFFYTHKKNWIVNLVVISCLIATLSLYQPCVNIYIALIASNILLKIKSYHKLNIIFIDLFRFIVASLLYFVVVMKVLGFATPRSHFISLQHPYDFFIITYNKILFFVQNLFFNLPIMLYLCISIIILISLISILYYVREEKCIKGKLIYLLAPFVLFLSLWGGLILIREPLIQPREFVVFSVLLFTATYICITINKTLINLLLCISCIYMFSFSFNANNVLKEQKDFEDQIYHSIYLNIINNKEIYSAAKIYINGRPVKSPILFSESKNIPLFNAFIEQSDKWVTRYSLIRMGINNIQDGFADDNLKQLEIICERKPIVDNLYYAIYKVNHSAVLWFKNADNKNNVRKMIPCEKIYMQKK